MKRKIGFQTIVSSVLIAGGLLIMPVTAYSTDRGELRRDARDTKQSGRQDARTQARDIKY
jgi:hypothetical protein